MAHNEIITGTPREKGIAAVNLMVGSDSVDALAKALAEQVNILANSSAEKVKRVSIERDGQGAISGSTVTETHQINEHVETLSGMISALLGYVKLYRDKAPGAKAEQP
jgi:hypothetical protein